MITARHATLLLCALGLAPVAVGAPLDDLLDRYAIAAKAADPGFAGFSAARGEKVYRTQYVGGKADSPACTSCHESDPRRAGRTRTGKAIDPMALSASPTRYRDAKKVEKWFTRNCDEVLGRACTPREKGDWLTYVMNQ